MSGDDVVLRLENVAKRFGPVQALRGVSLDARAGEVLALMGENGAGKSTLLRLMSGVQPPDAGRILLRGETVAFTTPHAARIAGVRVVAQEPEIIADVSVEENVYAGALPRRGRLFDRSGLRAQMAADLARYGFTGVISPDLSRPAADRGDTAGADRRRAGDRLRRADVLAVGS
jgi:L-arabinose transport system ATP-binding protein